MMSCLYLVVNKRLNNNRVKLCSVQSDSEIVVLSIKTRCQNYYLISLLDGLVNQ